MARAFVVRFAVFDFFAAAMFKCLFYKPLGLWVAFGGCREFGLARGVRFLVAGSKPAPPGDENGPFISELAYRGWDLLVETTCMSVGFFAILIAYPFVDGKRPASTGAGASDDALDKDDELTRSSENS